MMADENIVLLRSNKKRKLYQFNEKLYRLERLNPSSSVTYYLCYNCNIGRLNSSSDCHGIETFEETKNCSGNCNSSPEYVKALIAKQELIKICADRIDLTPQVCYENARRDLEVSCPEALCHFPSFLSMKSMLKRAKTANLPPIPTKLYDSLPNIIPDQFQLNHKGDANFLFLDVEYIPDVGPNLGPKRILGFMSFHSAYKLCQAKKIFLDGTFKVVPSPFYQLLTICTLRGIEDEARLIPRLFVLLPSKRTHCYNVLFTKLFEALQNKLHIARHNIKWSNASLDFENGLVAAFQQSVSPPGSPNPVVLEGCHFHFAQCLYRKLVTAPINMKEDYTAENQIIFRFFKKLVALAFLPSNLIPSAFKSLVTNELEPPYCDAEGTIVDTRLKAFLEYFINQWLVIGINLEMFNCYHRDDRRTNNDLEGWHMKIQRKLQFKHHSNLWIFINNIKLIDHDAFLEETQINRGQLVKMRSSRYRQKELNLARMRGMYDNHEYTTDIEYITALSSYMIEFHNNT